MAKTDEKVTAEASAPTPKSQPEKKSSKPAAKEKPKPARARKTASTDAKGKGHGWVWLAVLAALAGVGLVWQQQQTLTSQLHQQRTQLEGQLQQAQQRLLNLESDQQRRQQEVEQHFQALHQSLKGLERRVGQARDAWRIAEVEYLLSIANHRIDIFSDPASARAALKAADDTLRQLDNPRWNEVRQLIAQHLSQLKALPQIDLAGTHFRLDALSRQVDQLPLRADQFKTPAETTTDETAPADAWARFTQSLRGLVRIRQQDPRGPLLAPEQSYFLRQNLRLKIDAARQLLLSGEAEAFAAQLKTLGAWVKSYCDTQAPATQAFLSTLEELAQTPFMPTLPKVNEALERLRQLQQQLTPEQEPQEPASAPADAPQAGDAA